ncbi:MAG TPA: GntR family transcriptional regulator, partial [Ideonella sp.]|nr:GntR family transcriptional regulator [Ideonella sp.]
MESLKPARTLVEQAYERILDAICEGSLAPGERVTQDELAARLSVSRQPVMTALGLLRQQGFLVEHGRRGLQVAPADRARFDAIYQFRSA